MCCIVTACLLHQGRFSPSDAASALLFCCFLRAFVQHCGNERPHSRQFAHNNRLAAFQHSVTRPQVAQAPTRKMSFAARQHCSQSRICLTRRSFLVPPHISQAGWSCAGIVDIAGLLMAEFRPPEPVCATAGLGSQSNVASGLPRGFIGRGGSAGGCVFEYLLRPAISFSFQRNELLLLLYMKPRVISS